LEEWERRLSTSRFFELNRPNHRASWITPL
jgi:hypothetical protein